MTRSVDDPTRDRAAALLTAVDPTRPLVAPVSATQRALWLAEQRADGPTTYRVCRTVVLEGPLDVDAMLAALRALVARHEALRTTVPAPGGIPVQRVEPVGNWQPAGVMACDAAEADELAARDTAAPFDLAAGPLFRATLVRLAPDRHHLLLAMHHVVVDGATLTVLLRDLGALYAAEVTGVAPTLPPAGAFRDAVLAERRWLASAEAAARLDQRRRVLAGVPPLDLGRRVPARGAAGIVPVRAPLSALTDPRFGRVTVSQALVACYAVLLGRHTGRTDLAIGLSIANRDDWPHTAGCFTDTLVVRLDLGGDPRLGDLARQVRDAVVDGIGRRQPPSDLVAEAIGGTAPLYDAVASLLPDHDERLPLPGVRARVLPRYPAGAAKFVLNLQLVLHGADAMGTLVFDSAAVDRATATALTDRLTVLVAGADPRTRIGRLPLLPAAELAELAALSASPSPAHPTRPAVADPAAADLVTADPTTAASVTARFAAVAAARPDTPAVVDPAGATLTYRELQDRATALAAALAASGVRRGQRVAVLAERGVDLVVAVVAAATLGAPYVPLDPADPPARLADLARRARPTALVTTSDATVPAELVAALPARSDGVPVVLAASAPGSVGTRPDGARPTAADALYVVHTSGSTGRPKGVVTPHRAVLRLVADPVCAPPGARWLHAAPPTFDASTLELWAPLLTGGTVVVGPRESADLDALARAITAHGVQAAWLTAGLCHAMADHRPDALRALRLLITGGDVVSADHVRRVVDGWSGTLVDGYGPTENTTFTTRHAIAGGAPVPDPVPIGRPVPGTTVHLVDEHLALVPRGVVGELVTGGDGLADGYLDAPAATAERFVPDPFGERPGGRVYRTGDRCRWLPDGTLEFVGRADDQVKVRGFRVEPAEVEAALRAHPRVRDAAVVAHGQQLVGHVVGDAETAELDAHCAATLPRHLRPTAWERHDRLPLTANGKVDRAGLPPPGAAVDPRPGPGEPPRDGDEARVAEVWRDVLGTPVDDRDANFFDLGGHSLSAARIVARLRADGARGLQLRTLFDHPTLAAFAAAMTAEETT